MVNDAVAASATVVISLLHYRAADSVLPWLGHDRPTRLSGTGSGTGDPPPEQTLDFRR